MKFSEKNYSNIIKTRQMLSCENDSAVRRSRQKNIAGR